MYIRTYINEALFSVRLCVCTQDNVGRQSTNYSDIRIYIVQYLRTNDIYLMTMQVLVD